MEHIHLPTAMKNLKKSFPLLFSTGAALCLFLAPNRKSLLLVAAVFAAVFAAALLGRTKPSHFSRRAFRAASVVITVFITYIGYHRFITTWTPSARITVLADALPFTKPVLLLIVGLIGCVAGLYAIYTLSCWIVIWLTRLLKEYSPELRKAQMLANLKRNWFFPISAAAFFCLSMAWDKAYLFSLLLALLICVIAASQIRSVWDFVRQNRIGFHITAILTAIGICWYEQYVFYATWADSSKAQALAGMLPFPMDIPLFFSVLGAVAAVFFVYICVLFFWKKITEIFSRNRVFSDITAAEWIVYGVLIAASLALVIASFTQTKAFYGTGRLDIIYTSDSALLVRINSYLTLTHVENDLRQPLFAVFAAPFTGISYLFAKLFGISLSVLAILLNIPQVFMLFAANFLLAKMMKLTPVKRICFMLLSACTYTHLLFILMMEQYIVVYFWLILCIYLICENRRPDRIALWGAGGTLLTSMVLLPSMSEKNPVKNFKAWFTDMIKYGLEFVAVLLAFCRFDVIYDLTKKLSSLSKYTGKNLTVTDKLCQYTAFIRNCFAAPDAGVTTDEFASWQLNPVTSMNLIGVVIVLLVIVSAIVNRDKRSSLLAVGWAAFSAVVLLVMGWGTMENGLILYALYFGWAFLVLLFQLVEKIEDKLNVKFLVPLLCIGCAIVLAMVNIPAILEMVNFAITYYPV